MFAQEAEKIGGGSNSNRHGKISGKSSHGC